MTQPSYAPITEPDQIRPSYRLHAPGDWRADRPGDLHGGPVARRRSFGTPGPDKGYALLVAGRLFADRVEVESGESVADALAGAAELGGTRAALFGRAPVGQDIEHALVLFGFLGGAPVDLLAWRKPLFRSAAHEYQVRRALVDVVPDETMRLSADQVRRQLGQWRQLVVEPVAAVPMSSAEAS